MQGKLIFTALAQAYFVGDDRRWGQGSPRQGIKRMGDLAHAHNIPVTYLVTPGSAEAEADLLTEFHEDFGDEVQLQVYMPGKASREETQWLARATEAQLTEYIRQQRAGIEVALPWSQGRVVVAGTGHRDTKLVRVLDELGFEGLYGHCPFQIGTDEITHWGMPWGSYYISKGDYRAPQREKGLVALEWTARDLNNSFHYGRPEVFSTDPDDVRRGELCTPENGTYWRELFDEYFRNIFWNPFVFFQFHQEAHEMDPTVCPGQDPAWIEYDSALITDFYAHITKFYNMEFLVASDAVNLYRRTYEEMPPNLMLAKRIVVDKRLGYWNQVLNQKDYCGYLSKHTQFPDENLYDYIDGVVNDPDYGFTNAPWTDSLFYYDHECLLVFDVDRVAPVYLQDFTRPLPRPESPEPSEMDVPWFVVEEHPTIATRAVKDGYRVTIQTEGALPYGFTIWGEFSEFGEIKPSVGRLHRLEEKVILVRLNLPTGKTEVDITITKIKN